MRFQVGGQGVQLGAQSDLGVAEGLASRSPCPRIQKTELSIRPVWHQKKERVQAHIFVCFLAYVLWKTLEQWQKQAGLGNSPRTLLDELARLQSADIVLPTADDPRRELRIRCVVRPDKAQAELLVRLGLRLPQRLRPPTLPAQM